MSKVLSTFLSFYKIIKLSKRTLLKLMDERKLDSLRYMIKKKNRPRKIDEIFRKDLYEIR